MLPTICKIVAQTDRAFAKSGFCFLQKAKIKFCSPSPLFLQVEQVKLLDRFSTSNKSLTGTLYLTATHLLFIDSSQRETWVRIMNACSSKAYALQDAFVLPDQRLNLFSKMFIKGISCSPYSPCSWYHNKLMIYRLYSCIMLL